MTHPSVAILHFSASPVVGGVESVIDAHARALVEHGYPVSVIAGRGDAASLPAGVGFVQVPEAGSQYPHNIKMSALLEQGQAPPEFDTTTAQFAELLTSALKPFDRLIVHNVFTKHFNLPLTAALHKLLDEKVITHCIAWCHDFSWASPRSRAKMHPGYPWDLLRTHRRDVTYVTVSNHGQTLLADLMGCRADDIHTVYNGVEPKSLLGLSEQGQTLIMRLGLLESDLTMLMPVRITHAKNFEFAFQVVRALKKPGCEPRLVVTGPPDPHDEQSMTYFAELKALRRQLDLEKEVLFIFDAGPSGEPLTIEPTVVGDLFRVSDIMFMPSHHEGFGMPVLEAGLSGVQVLCSEIPAAQEIGKENVMMFAADEKPYRVAERILAWAQQSTVYQLRREVRQHYTWEALFCEQIEPLLADRG